MASILGMSEVVVKERRSTSLSKSMTALTLLFELQNGQLKATSSFCFCFLGGGFDDFRFPIAFFVAHFLSIYHTHSHQQRIQNPHIGISV
jgi:hypothetical protein